MLIVIREFHAEAIGPKTNIRADFDFSLALGFDRPAELGAGDEAGAAVVRGGIVIGKAVKRANGGLTAGRADGSA